jgi:outer membrane protein OmpA-like peptidoglycan-associated protein
MGSPLDYISTEGFRKKLMTRNLVPYAKSPSPATPPITYEVVQQDISVIDSPDFLIDSTFFADKQYTLNRWGSDGGYKQAPDISGNLNTTANKGEYGPGQQDAHIIDEAQIAAKKGFGTIAPAWQPLNAYGNGGLQQLDGGQLIESFDTISTPNPTVGGLKNLYNNQPYPTTFNPSSYSPISILLGKDPQGSDGLLSSDSFIARLGAYNLKADFQDRIGREIIRNTIGRANVLNINGSTNLVNILTGTVPLIEPNYTITVPQNAVLAATDFALRLAGSVIPVSTIPGSYWDTNVNNPQPTTIQQALLGNPLAAAGSFVSQLLGAGKTGSEIFYNNTGQGQKSILFKNINFNKYKPSYDRTFLDRLGGAIVGTDTNNANYYVGSTSSDPSRVFSPSRALPVDSFGREQQSPVYGPQELAQLYEGPSKDVRLGANGPTYSDGGGVEGGFTWVSPKYKGNAGKYVGVGGEIIRQNEDFKPSSYNSTESTERTFREGSILDDTQRIIDSQPQGGKRLQHVGNAIDQVSKVFHDGYKELTKGSRVLNYVGSIGQEVGTEYCRVFAKDIPYLQYNDLQKTNGITTEGRRFAYSVLDKTYNLNIVPNKQEGGQDSTNIIGSYNNAYAKKYMFSIENLAWATSNTPGYTVSDLAVCERGPNGGRVMWFPPYGLTFSENSTPNWNGNEFIGRPEPIYTYKSTSRTGSLSWKIVVDHPSVLNVIVNKVLGNETNKVRIDSILESFFAGCRKYDLYELAKKYYTISPNDLYDIQQALSSKEVTSEQTQYIVNTVLTQDQTSASNGSAGSDNATDPKEAFKQYEQLGFYFDNDIPKKFNTSFNTVYEPYVSQEDNYQQKNPSTAQQTKTFFNTVIKPNKTKLDKLIDEIDKQLTNNPDGTITITINGSASAPASKAYNDVLSAKRIDSAAIFFTANTKIKKYVELKKLIIVPGKALGEQVEPLAADLKNLTNFFPKGKVTCTDQDDKITPSQQIYTTNAMACRRAYISSIKPNFPPPSQPPVKKTTTVTQGTITKTETVPVIEEKLVAKDNISKKVLRALLSECDYFETIKEETPMVFDNLRDKLKFFQPAFHSMTPEGLNTRLTFLQQCMRPGDTIPVIRTDGNGKNVLQYNNATNTAFGAPPVLVLRVGDFYNTKIIPTGLQIQYENLDLNPEGIGVQPMIANVTLNFNFVGGSGLKESVDKLQNALTFNYYANTEIYDDRADATDLSYKVIDADFLKAAASNVEPPTVNQAAPNNGQDNNSTIGKMGASDVTQSGQTGTITYGAFFDKFVGETQNYFTNIVNKQTEITAQYNNAVRQQWMFTRNYTQGYLKPTKDTPTVLFGKPNNFGKRTDDIFATLAKDIKNENEGFIQFISDKSKNFTQRLINQVQDNYMNLVKNKQNSFETAVTNITNSIVTAQQTYIGYLSRINTVTYQLTGKANTGTDGFQLKNGVVTSYIVSGTTNGSTNTYTEFVDDVIKVKTKIDTFNDIIWSANSFTYKGVVYEGVLVFQTADGTYVNKFPVEQVFIPFCKNQNYITKSPTATFDNYVFRRVYMVVSDDVLDDKKYQTFKTAMIGNILTNTDMLGRASNENISKVFDSYWLSIAKPLFVEENEITKAFIDSLKKDKLASYLKYTETSKKREFTYTTEGANTDGQKALIKSLGATENQNTDKLTWNTESKSIGDVFISKVKLN